MCVNGLDQHLAQENAHYLFNVKIIIIVNFITSRRTVAEESQRVTSIQWTRAYCGNEPEPIVETRLHWEAVIGLNWIRSEYKTKSPLLSNIVTRGALWIGSFQEVQKQTLERSTLNCCWIKLLKWATCALLSQRVAKCEKASGPVLHSACGFKAANASG